MEETEGLPGVDMHGYGISRSFKRPSERRVAEVSIRQRRNQNKSKLSALLLTNPAHKGA